MLGLVVGRISYCSSNEKRMGKVRKTLDSLLQVLPDTVKVKVIAQCYFDNYIDRKRQVVCDYDEPLGPARARNILLKEFYDSDADYMLCVDDDVSLYDYYNVRGLLLDIMQTPQLFIEQDISIIKAIEPTYVPFKKANEKLDLEKKYVFCQAPMSGGGGLFILLNLRKHKGFEVYFDTDKDPRKGEGREDIDFFIRCMKKGLLVLECRNLVQKTDCNTEQLTSLYEEKGGEKIKQATLNTAKEHGIEVINGAIRYAKSLPYFKGKKEINAVTTQLKEKVQKQEIISRWS